MKIGIIGLKNSGKTTVFNALTSLMIDTTGYPGGKMETHLGTVEHKDPRITRLAEMYKPQKTVYTHFEFLDFMGLSGGKEEADLLNSAALAALKFTDALAIVLRNFPDELQGIAVDPLRDLTALTEEMILSDLIIAEKRIEKIELSKKRGIKDPLLQIEEKTLLKVIEHLNRNLPLIRAELNDEEEKAIRGFQFISRKPVLVILNSAEDNFHRNDDIIIKIEEYYPVIEFAGKFEMELNNLDPAEAFEFMAEMNIVASAQARLIEKAYEVLGYISFFTVGKDEVRAWTISKGDNALTAAGKIHSDLARGFIRAECFSYKDLIEAGSEKVLKEKGLFRLEGKNYLVQDGNILHIRFSV
ncbi:MAG: redox-regulated ATPase YchF [Candidatus Cloacimonetes bacterium]|nr:redox-regulated ATPase YchF [Candidatus Cloacimonadota bacterium]